MTKVYFAITAHVVRSRMLGELLKRVGTDGWNVFMDTRKLMNWGNAWRIYDDVVDRPDFTHVCIIQDDVWPVAHFMEAVRRIAANFPDNPVGLYVPRREVMTKLYSEGESFVILKNLAYGQGNIIPTRYVRDFLFWEESHIDKREYLDDVRLCLYFGFHKIDFYYTVPSLVQHLGAGKTITHKPNRLAYGNHQAQVYDPDFDPLSRTWEKPNKVVRQGSFTTWAKGNVDCLSASFIRELGWEDIAIKAGHLVEELR